MWKTSGYQIMPYIKKEDRKKIDKEIKNLVEKLTNHGCDLDPKVGNVNYVLSSIIWMLFDNKPSYTNGNNLIGVLECVKQEFYRRKLAKLEDQKITENGDL
jgi:hypothetical protein